MQRLQQKLLLCKSDLRKWSWQKHGSIEMAVKEKTRKLELLQRNEGPWNFEEIKVLQGEIAFLLEQEDMRWKQWAKQNWYQNGDRNTPFFHAWASHRRRINQIRKIMGNNRVEWRNKMTLAKPSLFFIKICSRQGGWKEWKGA